MATLAYAHIAYGFDLGDFNGWRISAPLDEHGDLAAPWWDNDSATEVSVQIYDALYAAIPDAPPEPNADQRGKAAEKHWGVEVAIMGNDSFEGWLLIATGTEQSIANCGVITLKLLDLEHPPHDAFMNLENALEALGITPERLSPEWLVYPSYG